VPDARGNTERNARADVYLEKSRHAEWASRHPGVDLVEVRLEPLIRERVEKLVKRLVHRTSHVRLAGAAVAAGRRAVYERSSF
jgi:hypothetical protein